MDSNVVLSKKLGAETNTEKEHMKHIPYLSTVGSLMYLSMATWPDITFAVGHLRKYMSNPGQAHWTAAQRVICHLNGTWDIKLVLGGKKPV
jgi:hypothetical protein